MTNYSRRDFLKLSAALSVLVAFPPKAKATDEIQELFLRVKRDGVVHQIVFVKNGALLEEGYIELCTVFKDKHADVAVKMDPALFSILAQGQKWLSGFGYNDPLVLTSGYRTKFTNMHTEGAAEDSMHIYGKAADIKYPGLPVFYLAQLFRSYGASGIGIYSNFIHVDTWKTRIWRG